MNKLQKYATIATLVLASYVTPQTGTVSGDVEEATKETFRLMGKALNGIRDAMTPQDLKDNSRRLLGQLLDYYQIGFVDLFDDKYKEKARNHVSKIAISNMDVNFCGMPSRYEYDVGDKCVSGNATITFDDDRIPQLSLGLRAKLMPLTPDASVYNRNYNVDLESIVSLNPNTKQVQRAFDYYNIDDYNAKENGDNTQEDSTQEDNIQGNNTQENSDDSTSK